MRANKRANVSPGSSCWYNFSVERGSAVTYEAIVVDGVDVSLLGHQEAEAPACGVFEGDAPGLFAQHFLDVVTIVQFVIESFRYLDLPGRIAVLHDDQMVLFEEGPPQLQEVQVSYRRDDNVQFLPPIFHPFRRHRARLQTLRRRGGILFLGIHFVCSSSLPT